MIEDDLNPPHVGLNADPILYGVAAGLAVLFPPVLLHGQDPADQAVTYANDADPDTHDAD